MGILKGFKGEMLMVRGCAGMLVVRISGVMLPQKDQEGDRRFRFGKVQLVMVEQARHGCQLGKIPHGEKNSQAPIHQQCFCEMLHLFRKV